MSMVCRCALPETRVPLPPCFPSPQGYEVDIYEQRPWVGGKVASFKDKDGNDIEMGLHVFFGAVLWESGPRAALAGLASWAGASGACACTP